MVENSASSPPQRSGAGRIGWWLLVLVSAGLLAFLIIAEVIRYSTPIPLHRLQVVQDIPLPDALPDPNRTSSNPFAPGKAERFDHFDFQALDPNTHLLFMVHSGPNPDKEVGIADSNFHGDQTDGNIVVFNTQLNRVVGLVDVPQAAGVVVAPDLGKAFAGDAAHGIVYAIDEHGLTAKPFPIHLDPLDGPDAMEYDSLDHRIFVADPGVPVDPNKSANIPLENQNVAVIDAITNTLITKIPLGIHPPFGDDVGHIQFDPVTHRVFVVTLPLHDQDATPVEVTPPSFLDVIDPTLPIPKVISQIKLPDSCVGPHGLAIDVQQREAFVACVESPQQLVRVDLQAMKPLPDTTPLPLAFNPDIVRIDTGLHLVYVGCAGGISIFDESSRGLKKLGEDIFLGGGSHHTLAIDESTHLIYLPLASVGGRPVLRIIRYIANGV
jgi:hypothetical protein